MSSLTPDDPRRGYWRSLAELNDDPEFRRFAEGEFPEEAPVPTDALSRRRFLQIMGASVALAGVAGCRWPRETIVPFADRPEGVTPGQTRRFATSLDIGGVVRPLLVTSYDGRPIKAEGNPEHPLSLGATDLFAQAAVLELYDPDRSRGVAERRGDGWREARWDDLARLLHAREQERRRGGGRLLVLADRATSPTRAALRDRLLRDVPGAAWAEWDPALGDDPEATGTAAVFGAPHRALPRLDAADRVACFGADPLGEHPAFLRNTREFSARRRPDAGPLNRLYVFETDWSQAGVMADHRFPLAPTAVTRALYDLAAALVLDHGLAPPPGTGDLAGLLRRHRATGAAHPAAAALARDLLAHRGRSLVLAGPRQPAAAHALAAVLNLALDAAGRTVAYVPEPPSPALDVAAAANLLRDGAVDTLVVLGGNPAFDAPADLDLAALIGKAGFSVHLSGYRDETSRLCTWHAPRAHPLEGWSDVRDPEGRYGVVQPLIAPLHGGRTDAELLSLLLEPAVTPAHDLVRATARERCGVRDDAAWRRLLRDGLLPGDRPGGTVRPAPRGLADLLAAGAAGHAADGHGDGALELSLRPHATVGDGRFANNAWLQETPDFATKITWDNAALLGVATARALGVATGDVVRVTAGKASVELPAYVLPGHAPGAVTLTFGHGRRAAGGVGDGVGTDTYPLRTADHLHIVPAARLEPTGRRAALATTQDHFAIDRVGREGRAERVPTLIIEGTEQEYRRDPHFVEHRHHVPPLRSLWEERDYTGRAWGMAIDLSACTGCNACSVACYAENNIPVVGKEQVMRGREMAWLRLDRYFTGDPDQPRVAHQPVACVQCEMAPCEQVCPVAATMHSQEGLNVMVYNRCVGTRYCSNNCPYKVRRFNFFNYNKEIPELRRLGFNPQVTLRARGVMEKCTYCVQRIEHAKIQAKNEGRPVRDGEITPACAQTCPADAIVFGDLNDKESRVARLHADHRAYHMLAELNLKPRTAYLARLRNPNPELVEMADEPAAH